MNKKFLTALTSIFAGLVMTSASMVFVPSAYAAGEQGKAASAQASAKASGSASKPAKKPKKDKKPKASASK